MADRTSSMGSKHRLSKMLFQERITGTDDEIAQAHEVNRQSAVKEILVHVFFMSKFNIIGRNLAVGEAEVQYRRGSGNDQAAHCAPGQILFGNDPIQTLLASHDLELAVENLFAKTDEIDVKFNKADSRAEANGLRAALLTASNQVAGAAKNARFNRAHQFYPFIDAGFNAYRLAGVRAFEAAILEQRNLARASLGAELSARLERIMILERYRATLETAYDTLETVQDLFPEELWREYRAIV